MELHPGHDLEAGAPAKRAKGEPHPKAAPAWIYWRYNVLYILATLVMLPLTSACRRGQGRCRPRRPGAVHWPALQPALTWRCCGPAAPCLQ